MTRILGLGLMWVGIWGLGFVELVGFVEFVGFGRVCRVYRVYRGL